MTCRCIVTTSWDDGHELDLKVAEVLRKYRVQGTFFVSLRYLKGSISEQSLVRLSKDFEIGSHTVSHRLLTAATPSEQIFEIQHSKKLLEKIIGRRIYGFCPPGNAYDEQTESIVRNAGFFYVRTGDDMHVAVSNRYRMGTTVFIHPYCVRNMLRTISVARRLPLANIGIALGDLALERFSTWSTHARLMFDYAHAVGGIWHLRGHSWEVERFDMWNELEQILRYVSNRRDVSYLTNYEVIRRVFPVQLYSIVDRSEMPRLAGFGT